jgi:hypothetical protein
MFWYIQREGVIGTLRHAASVAIPRTQTTSAPLRLNVAELEEVKDLQPGEWVEVKSREEILATLDANGKHRGLRFVPEMFEYCGQSFKVLKRVEKICIENTPDVRKLKNTVLLEGGLCQGGGIGCDRSCFHFWREIWLRRIPSQRQTEWSA